jgi:hypothetical protein
MVANADNNELSAEFEIDNVELDAEFELPESANFDALFEINATPGKVSQLENDLNFQTGEQVAESINEASAVINTRIDGVVEAFDNEIEDINGRMIDSIEGSELIGVSRTDNRVNLTSRTFVFEQGIASDTWVIEHNLNKHPSAFAVDSAGKVQIPNEIVYNNNNQITLYFLSQFSGKAYLN